MADFDLVLRGKRVITRAGEVARCIADAGPLLEKLAQGLARERIGGTTP